MAVEGQHCINVYSALLSLLDKFSQLDLLGRHLVLWGLQQFNSGLVKEECDDCTTGVSLLSTCLTEVQGTVDQSVESPVEMALI